MTYEDILLALMFITGLSLGFAILALIADYLEERDFLNHDKEN